LLPRNLKFPFDAHTRAGSKVTITGFYNGYTRPWVGFLEVDLIDDKFLKPYSWLESGAYVSEEKERALDLIDLPI
jgi:hypothetical protein